MKIKKVSCTQFAGVRDRDVSFADGMNVVYGKNESGKSTLVNLISRTLFQNARIDGRSDKEFRELYYPGARKGSSLVGDFADGKISFETKNGVYTLTKEWGTDARCLLSTPEGVVRDQKTVDAILKEVLLYGEGVYADMLFSSQRNTDFSLQTILDASKKTDAKQEIVDAVSQAFAESDGISVDAIEQAIQAKIDAIVGKHWDLERNAPARKAGRWASGLGEILKAYYALEDARAVLKEISQLEKDACQAAELYTDKDGAVRVAEDAYNRFNTFASRLALQNERKKIIDSIHKELRKSTDVLSDWPGLADNLKKAQALQTEMTNRELLDKYESARQIMEELAQLKNLIPSCHPEDSEIVRVRSAQRDISRLENKLCGMNLTAAIQMSGGHGVEIVSLRTGQPVDVADGIASITETVKITVPGVMEMQLSPADVDVAAIESRIGEHRAAVSEIFEKYNVDSLDALEALARSIKDTETKIDAANSRLGVQLGATAFEELETAAQAITTSVRAKEDIQREIRATCGGTDVARYVAVKETVVSGYVSDYGGITQLQEKVMELQEKLSKAQEAMEGPEDIPAEYLSITNPEQHLEMLQNDLKEKQQRREDALTKKTTAMGRLEGYKENISGDPEEDAQRAREVFEEQKSLLSHWQHIAQVFKAQKENLHDNPMGELADRFAHYLSVISGGKVSSEFPEEDRLCMSIYSDNRLLDYGKLSEGTKETVSLAFRLAVLDHLFPEGGGVIVFDDPFTDMDAERTAQACALIKDCALRHQVIFLTCKEDYLSALEGNHILV